MKDLIGIALAIAVFAFGVFLANSGFDELTGKIPLDSGVEPGEPIGAVIIGVVYCVGSVIWVWQALFPRQS